MNIKTKPTYLLILIIVIAIFLRFYQLGVVPPSISWDEAAVGYNAWTIVHSGKDEWGNILPLVFKSFEDDKHPVHFYLTAPFVLIFGLTDFATRFAPALFGVLNVLLLYLVGKDVFKNRWVGLLSSFLLAISPYSIQFSRFNHEANFALFFFLLGFWLFYKFLNGTSSFLIWATLSFCVSILSYHAALIVVPLVMLSLLITYRKDVLKTERDQLVSLLIIVALFLLYTVIQPSFLGLARAKQTSISESINNSKIYQYTDNLILGSAEVVAGSYLAHFSPQYLFISGDKNPKFSTQAYGQFYVYEAILLLAGLLWIVKYRKKEHLVILVWALLAPLPASLTGGEGEVPHAARALFTMGSWQIIEGLGLVGFLSLIKSLKVKATLVSTAVLVSLVITLFYFNNYLNQYPKDHAIAWQYGMKQVAEHIKLNPEYEKIYMTDVRSQPYIFLLYYLKTPVTEFLNDREFNLTDSRNHNLISQFGKYNFGNWDPIESYPLPGILYILTPSQYDGLRHRALFQIKELISYPNGTDAFYLVSLY